MDSEMDLENNLLKTNLQNNWGYHPRSHLIYTQHPGKRDIWIVRRRRKMPDPYFCILFDSEFKNLSSESDPVISEGVLYFLPEKMTIRWFGSYAEKYWINVSRVSLVESAERKTFSCGFQLLTIFSVTASLKLWYTVELSVGKGKTSLFGTALRNSGYDE